MYILCVCRRLVSMNSYVYWSRRFLLQSRLCAPAPGTNSLRFLSVAAGKLTACGNSTCAPWHLSSRFSSDANRNKEKDLRSKSNLYDTPTDEHRLLLIQPEYKMGRVESPYVSAEVKLEEAKSLAEAISGWTVHTQRIDAVRQLHSKTFFGKGKITELKQFAGNLPVTGVFLNVPQLTPIQHRTLEGVFKTEVFDRFGIVLQIFKERARTKEAKLQVALAEIPYLRTRLAGTEERRHREGEVHHTVARRNLNQREVALRRELKSIRERRQVMGLQRKRHHLPVVAIVGYTNSGKTTLIKALSKDETMEPKDMLFATLDTTVHAGKLPCGQKVLFVDTIGFVSDLPHELVESFSSTLDDVTHADVLLHVRDLSHPQSYAQKSDVMKVLNQLNLTPGLVDGMLEVGNKSDQVDGGSSDVIDGLIPISALHGTGLDNLLHKLEDAVITCTRRKIWKIVVPSHGPELSWLYHEPEATVCEVSESIETPQPLNTHQLLPPTPPLSGDTEDTMVEASYSFLSVKTILTEAAFGKFQARFSHSVKMIECK